MAPGALQRKQRISPLDKLNLNLRFNKNDARTNLTSEDAVITHQSTHIDSSSDNGESSPRMITTRMEIKNYNYLFKKYIHDLDLIKDTMQSGDVENTLQWCLLYVENAVKGLFADNHANAREPTVFTTLFYLVRKAWEFPTCELGYALCNRVRDCGLTDLLIKNCVSKDPRLQFSSTRLLVECLNSENRDYVIKNGMVQLQQVIRKFRHQEKRTADQSIVITGLLAKLFEHSEETCMDVIEWGGLEIVVYECRRQNTSILQNCARALANLSLYGDSKIHKLMINNHAHIWLFTLAFNPRISVKYYALLAASVLATDKDIKAVMDKCDTLNLIDIFIAKHFPAGFDKIDKMLARYQSQDHLWLKRLVIVLSSGRREAHTFAAFHFCTKAYPQSQCHQSEIAETFKTIGAIIPLKELVVSGNKMTSSVAAQALQWIGEEVPRPLNKKVPRWTVKDVLQWLKSVGFEQLTESLTDDQMNGNWLLKLTEECLEKSLGMRNGIMRKRFMRELQKLKKLADYSYEDPTNLHSFLQSIRPDCSVYTYSIVNAGYNCYNIGSLTDDRLEHQCGIKNSFYRRIILNSIKGHHRKIYYKSNSV